NLGLLIDRLDLHKQSTIDYEVSSVAAVELYSLVGNWSRLLSFEGNRLQGQFVAEADLVCRLQQAGAECAMHFDCTANHGLAEVIHIDSHLRDLRILCG